MNTALIVKQNHEGLTIQCPNCHEQDPNQMKAMPEHLTRGYVIERWFCTACRASRFDGRKVRRYAGR